MTRSPDDMSKEMFFACLTLMLVAFVLALHFLISLSSVEYGGVNYTPVGHFETYNHCGGAK